MVDTKKETEHEKEEPYGYVYRITNEINGKVYIGKVECERFGESDPIEGRFQEHLRDADRLQRERDSPPGEYIYGTHLNNAMNKYGIDNFTTKEIDAAHSLDELNEKERHHIKEHDSLDRNKGYNMHEGGAGGRMSDDVRERLREIYDSSEYREKQRNMMIEKWEDPEFRQKMIEAKNVYAQDPEWLKKITEINQQITSDPNYRNKMSEILNERAKDPKWREKISEANTRRWQNPENREKQREAMRNVWQDPKYQDRMKEISNQRRKEINLREVLAEIKNGVKMKDILIKQDIGKTSFSKRIQEHFGPEGIKNFTELKEYLKDKKVEDVVREVEERSKLADSTPNERSQDDAKTDIKKESNETTKEKYLNHDNYMDSRKSFNQKAQPNVPPRGGQGGGAGNTGPTQKLPSNLAIGKDLEAFEGGTSGRESDLGGIGAPERPIDSGTNIFDGGGTEPGDDLDGLDFGEETKEIGIEKEEDAFDGEYRGW
ncbi:MAG: hypothetical protein ACFFAS_01890 [Promethearchaeota archaeon]